MYSRVELLSPEQILHSSTDSVPMNISNIKIHTKPKCAEFLLTINLLFVFYFKPKSDKILKDYSLERLWMIIADKCTLR